ncbi:MAG: hypothetical protein Q9190_004622 [Brigantiaea leucoxantha]
MRVPFFRIFYSTTFTVLSIVTAVLLLITPADQIYQSFNRHRIYNIFIIAGAHLLTLIISVLLYASRIYTNRRNLIAIPKQWSPLAKGDVEQQVRKLVADQLEASAVIAYNSHPRDLKTDEQPAEQTSPPDNVQAVHASQAPDPATEIKTEAVPPWGIVNHPGWAPPSSPDLPNLQYEPVVKELANLIEAKAVSLAPPDPLYDPTSIALNPDSEPDANSPPEPPLPDAVAIELLQRPSAMGLREYFIHLTTLNMIQPPHLADSFLPLYDKARFSDTPLTEPEFRSLMGIFAEILRGLQPLDMELVTQLHADNESLSKAVSNTTDDQKDRDSIITTETVNHTPLPSASINNNNTSAFFTPRPDHHHHHGGSPHRSYSAGARSTTSSRHTSSRSLHSRPSQISIASSSNGSVIRLADARTPLDLPYTIILPGSGSESAEEAL